MCLPCTAWMKAALVKPKVAREQRLPLIARRPPCRIGMEACSGAHSVCSPALGLRFPSASPWPASRPCGTTQALTPAAFTSATGLPAYLAQTSRHSAANHEGDPDIAFTAIPACPMGFRLHHGIAGSPSLPAESSSSFPDQVRDRLRGLPVRFRLLPTQPRNDAVTFSFGVMACPGTDLHQAVCAHSRAHGTQKRRFWAVRLIDWLARIFRLISQTQRRW